MNTEKKTPTTTIRNVYLSTDQRDTSMYPSASDFTVDLPVTLKQVYGISIRNYKFTPESLINSNNSTVSFGGLTDSTVLNGTISIPPGDYSQDINALIAAVNNELSSYQVQFTLVNGNVVFGFSGSYINKYFYIPYCKLLSILGYTNGVCIYRTEELPENLPQTVIPSESTGAAATSAQVINNTDLILRINGVETIISANSSANRATAVLMATRSPNATLENIQKSMYPLLQVQSRIQRLQVQLLNVDGEFYDFNNDPASFILEFHHFADVDIM